MNKTKSRLSIKEIAKLSNVSVATVSRVINNNGRFSEETRQKVQRIIDEYGYTTNIRFSKTISTHLLLFSKNYLKYSSSFWYNHNKKLQIFVVTFY